MKYSRLELWDFFKKAVDTSIKAIGSETIKKAWYGEISDFTSFYRDVLLMDIAKYLSEETKLEIINTRNNLGEFIGKEFLCIDCTFTIKATNGYQVPIASIEYENDNGEGTAKEILKLCALRVPLKVLFLWVEGNFTYKDFYDQFVIENEWNDIMMAYNEIYNQEEDFIGIIVAEFMGGQFKYHSFIIKNDGGDDENGYEAISL